MPQYNQIHVDQALTNLSLAYMNEDYIAGQVMPALPVDKRSDLYFVYGKEHLRYRNAVVQPGAVAEEFNYSLSRNPYYAQRRAERHLVTDDEMMNEDEPLEAAIDTTELLSELMTLIWEVDVANYLTSNTNLTNYTALSGTSQWTDYVNSVPLTNLKTAKASVRKQSLKRANTLVIPYEGALVAADHPSLKDLTKYTDPKGITESGLPAVVRGLRVVEAGAVSDQSIEGRTFSPSAAWGNNIIVAYINPGPGRKKISLGYTFMAPDATSGIQGIGTRRYREEARKGEWVETEVTYDYRIVAVGAGYLYTGAY